MKQERLQQIFANLLNKNDEILIRKMIQAHESCENPDIQILGGLICLDTCNPFVYFIPNCCVGDYQDPINKVGKLPARKIYKPLPVPVRDKIWLKVFLKKLV